MEDFNNPLLAKVRNGAKTKKINLKLSTPIRQLLEKVVNHYKRPLVDDNGHLKEGATLTITTFVSKTIYRYNRLCCDGYFPELNLEQVGPFNSEISLRIEETTLKGLQAKAAILGEKNDECISVKTLLRALIEWRLAEEAHLIAE